VFVVTDVDGDVVLVVAAEVKIETRVVGRVRLLVVGGVDDVVDRRRCQKGPGLVDVGDAESVDGLYLLVGAEPTLELQVTTTAPPPLAVVLRVETDVVRVDPLRQRVGDLQVRHRVPVRHDGEDDRRRVELLEREGLLDSHAVVRDGHRARVFVC
jgi:hypothetical protein